MISPEPMADSQMRSGHGDSARAGKPVVVCTLATYSEQVDATGPNQSLRALGTSLAGIFEFRIVSCDMGATAPSGWRHDGINYVQRLPGRRSRVLGLLKLLRNTDHDVLLLSSFFDFRLSIPVLVLRWIGMIPPKPTILSPRGELGSGALSLKPRKKRIWLAIVRRLGLTQDVWLHATAQHEQSDIEKLCLPSRGILYAPDTSILPELPEPPSRDVVRSDAPLRIVFLGRIAPVKNILFAIEVLAGVSCPVDFDLYGPLEDPEYWKNCTVAVARLPAHVSVVLHAPLPHSAVVDTLAQYDLLFLPSLGENYGHTIHESLSAGTPVLISDRTPWRSLQDKGAGWDLPLDRPTGFVEAIEQLARCSGNARKSMRARSRRLAEERFVELQAAQRNRDIIQYAMTERRTIE